MNKVTINGKTYHNVNGKGIIIEGSKIKVDGVVVDSIPNKGQSIKIEVEGDGNEVNIGMIKNINEISNPIMLMFSRFYNIMRGWR